MTHYSILHILLSVYGVENCCAVLLIIQMLPSCLFKDTRKIAADRDCFGSIFYLYHPLPSSLQALAETVWEISRCFATASLMALSALPARGPAGFINLSLLSISLLILQALAVRVWWVSRCPATASWSTVSQHHCHQVVLLGSLLYPYYLPHC
jgi:hypothetical protein